MDKINMISDAAGQARRSSMRTLFAAAAALAVAAAAQAALGAGGVQPTGVAAGSATFQRSGADTVIRAANNTIINYSSFDIPAGAQVQFIQPSASARVLNRIDSVMPSKLDGTLTANGIVYFSNPSGIIFGPNSVVNVGQIFAAAGTISDAHFMANINQFTGNTGSVLNSGTINAQAVHLIGARAANFGSIVAPDGVVTMTSGSDVYLGDVGSHVMVKVSGAPTGGTTDAPAVENAGTINAGRGMVSMGAGDVYALATMAVRNTGSVKAKNVAMTSGQNGVTEDDGTIDASDTSGTGGTVRLLGQQVILQGARIDASGPMGGGTVLIGGNAHGAGPEPDARATYVSPDSVIRADATGLGEGGNVVVWSNEYTYFGGTISARGGALGGNGGSVEVSGKDYLAYAGFTDVTAPAGATGTLLLDPTDINIVSGATDTPAPTISGGPTHTITYPTNPGTASLSVTTLETQLNAANVTVDATSGTGAPNGGAIDVQASFNWTTAHNLILQSGTTITVENGVTISTPATGTSNITFTAGTDITINGTLILNSNGAFNSTGVNFTLNGSILTNTGAVTIDQSGAVAINGGINAGSATNNGLVTINANNAGTGGAAGFSMNSTASIQTANTSANAVAITVNHGAAGTGGAVLGNIDTGVGTGGGGAITVDTSAGSGGGAITFAGGAATGLNTLDTAGAATGTVTLTTPTGGSAGIGASGAGNIILTKTATLALTTGSGGLFVSNATNGTFSGSTAGGNISLATTGAASTLTIGATGVTSAAGAGTLTLTGGGGIVINGNVGGGTYTGAATLSTGAGSITGNGGTITAGSITLAPAANVGTTGTAVRTATAVLAITAANFNVTNGITPNLTSLAITTQPGGGGSFWKLVANNLTTYNVASTNGTDFTTVSATLTGGPTFSFHTTSGSIQAGTINVGATGTAALTADGSGASIGVSGTPLATTAQTVTALATSNVFIDNTVTASFNVAAGGNIGLTTDAGILHVVTGTLVGTPGVQTSGGAASTINLAGNAGISVEENLGASTYAGTITLNTTAGNIVETAGKTITAGTLQMTAAGAGAEVGTVGTPISSAASSITASANTGGVFITNSTVANFAATATGAGNVQLATTAGTLTVNGPTTTGSGSIVLTGPAGIAVNAAVGGGGFSGTVTVNADTSGTAGDFTMSGTGSIATTATTGTPVAITVNTGTAGTGAATLGSISTGDGATINVDTSDAGNTTGGSISFGSGTLNAGATGAVVLTTGTTAAGIGAGGAMQVTAATVTASSGTAGVAVQDSVAGSFNVNSGGAIALSTGAGILQVVTGTLAGAGVQSTGSGAITLTGAGGVQIHAPVGGASYSGTVAINAVTGNFAQDTGAGALISTSNTTSAAVAIGVNTGGAGSGTASVGTITVSDGGTIAIDTSDGGVATSGGNITKAGAADILTAGPTGTVRLVVGDTTTAGAIGVNVGGGEIDTNAGKLVLSASNYNVANNAGTIVTDLDISTRIVAGGFRTLAINGNWSVSITDDGVSVFTPTVSNTADNPTFSFTGLEGGSAAGAVTVAIPVAGIDVGTGTVNLTATGGDINNAASGIITAGTLGAFASSGAVGAGGSVLTYASTIRSISGAGGTNILSGSATTASFNVNSAGSITVGSVASAITTADLGLASPGVVSSAASGTISVVSNAGVSINAPVGGAGYGGTILLESGSGNFTQATGASAAVSTTNTSATAISVVVNANGDGPGTATVGSMSTGSGGTITVDTTSAGTSPSGGSIIAAGAADSLSAGTGVVTLITGTGGAQAIGGSGVGQAINTAAGTLNLTTGNGGIFVSNTAATTTLGTLTFTGGSVSIASTGDMAVPALTTGSGSFTFQSSTGTLTINGTLLASGDVTLTGAAVALGASVTSSGGTGTVTATAGAITQSAGTLAAPTLVLQATGDIVGPLSINTTTLTAGSTSGNLDLVNAPAGSVQVLGLHTVGGTISYDQTSGGDLTLTAPGGGGTGISTGDATHFGGDVTFKNDFAGGNNTINAVIDTTGNSGAGGTLTLTGGGIALNVAPALGQGNISIGAKGLDLVVTVPLTNAVTLSAARDIIIQSSVVAKAGNDLTLSAGASGIGGVWVQSTGTVTGDPGHNVLLQGQSIFAAGAAGEAVRIDAGGIVQTSGAGGVTLERTATTSATTMTVNGDITAGAGGISITGESGINLGATLTTAGGPITLTTGGVLPFFVAATPVQLTADAALITTGSASTGAAVDLAVGAAGNTHDLVLDGGTAGTVTLGGTSGVSNLTVRSLALTLGSSVSAATIRFVSAGVVDQTGGSLTATTALGVNAADDVTLGNVATPTLAVNTTGNNVLVGNTGSMDVGTVAADAGALFAATSGVTASGAGPCTINLSATGSITQSAGLIDAGAAGGITLASGAASGLGTPGTPLLTSAAGGSLQVTGGSGGAFISHTGDVAVAGSAGAAAEINIASTGDITQLGVTPLTAGTVTLTVTGSHKIGTSTPSPAPILTSAGTVNATSGSGEILVTSNITATFAVATTGDVTLTTTAGNLLTSAAGTFTANNLTLTSAGGISVQGTTSVGGVLTASTGAGATFANSGAITLGTTGSVITADGFNSLATITVTPAGGSLTIHNVTSGQQVALGADDSAGVIGITAAELANLHAPLLIIGQTGAPATGAISIPGSVAAAAGTTLHLLTASTISGAGVLTADSLGLTAGSTINVSTATTHLAAATTGPITISNNAGGANTLSIAGGTPIDGVANLTSGGAAIALTETTGGVTLNGNVNAGASTVAITLDGVDKTLTTVGTATITGTGGITLTADHMSLSGTGTIDATGATATLKPHLATDAVDFGGATTAGTLTLTSAGLGTIKANVLVVGQAGGGAITLTSGIAPAQAGALHLITGSTISGAGPITVSSLALTAGSTISVAASSTALAATTPGVITITDNAGGGTLTIPAAGTPIDGVASLASTGNHAVSLTETNGNVVLAGNVSAGSSSVAITLSGAQDKLTNNATITGTNGVTLTADAMALAGGAINAGTKIATLAPDTPGRTVNLGSAADPAAGALGLSAAEIDTITAGRLTVGSGTAGNITVTQNITPTGTTVLVLHTNSGIVHGSAGTDLTVANLALIAGSGIGAASALQTATSNLAYQNGNSAVNISNSGALNITSVAGVATSSNLGTTTNIATASPLVFAVNTTSAGVLSASASTDLTVNSGVSVTSGNGINFTAGHDITLSSGSAVTSTGGAIPLSFTSTSGGQITFNEAMGIGGTVSSFQTNTAGLVVFQNNASEVDATWSITFLPTFITHPAFATVARPAGDMALRVGPGGAITFAPGSNFVVVGGMNIEAPGGTATLGDLSALGSISVDASVIRLQSRAADGRSGDEGLDVVTGGTLTFTAIPTATNPALGIISFATTNGQNTDDTRQTLVVAFGLRHQGPIVAGDFGAAPTINDLIAQGPTNTSIVQSLAGVIPRSVETLSPERGESVSGAARNMLREMGVFGRDLTDEELLNALLGYISSDDSPKKLLPRPQDYTVASNRLPYAPVVPTIAMYQELFFGPKLDANGKPVLDSNGKVVRDPSKPQDETIRKVFETAWKAYQTKMNDNGSAAGFRAYLVAAGDKQALDYLDRLRNLINAIQQLGLTTVEFNVSKTILVSRVKPPGVNVAQFTLAILGSGETPRAAGAATQK